MLPRMHLFATVARTGFWMGMQEQARAGNESTTHCHGKEFEYLNTGRKEKQNMISIYESCFSVAWGKLF